MKPQAKCPTRAGKILYNPGAQVCQECDHRFKCERDMRDVRDKDLLTLIDRYHPGRSK